MVHRLRRETRCLGQAKRIVEPDRSGEGEWYGEWWICGCSGHQTRHRLVHHDRIRRAQRGLAVPERIPGETQPRLEVVLVLAVWIVEISAHSQQGTTRRIKNNETVVTLGGRHIPVGAQTEFKREVRLPAVIVL